MDVFAMPEVEYGNSKFDCILLSVDRLSGWVIAKPTTKLGLTAQKAANLMMDGGWDIFGVPTTITSDQGAQFIGVWWRTICARLGVRQAYSQAHRPQANGRAEVAGQKILELLKKLNVEAKINWVEALPRVLTLYHDSVGPSGLSPYNIIFGRHRISLGIPYPPERSCEDAETFMDRMGEVDHEIALRLNLVHEAEALRINRLRGARVPFKVGDKVLLLKPKSLSSQAKLEARWVGPMTISDRKGLSSFAVRDLRGGEHDAHMDQLRPFISPPDPVDLTLWVYNRREVPSGDVVRGSIRDHCPTSTGGWEFLVVQGDPPEGIWESAELFVNNGLLETLWVYARDHAIPLSIPDLLPPRVA
jgi:hypothetical protein